ncbi:MAG: MBL fold metallo-hydrolase [Verrucomicrobiota bacterium]|nr:MBL fold metallo-hydrolase [Verrucomicrobiota bacterium]
MIPLEDTFADVLNKSLKGLGLAPEHLAQRAGVSLDEIGRLRKGEFIESALVKCAEPLRLDAAALVALGKGKYLGPVIKDIPGFKMFRSVYSDFLVNAYLVWDKPGGVTLAFDTGTDIDPMLEALSQENLTLDSLCLTHIHNDHVMELDRLTHKGKPGRIVVGKKEPIEGADSIADEGFSFTSGDMQVTCLETWGHSPGGITYVVKRPGQPLLAFVGDSIFAGSMGGGNISYEAALRNNREKILTLPDKTILCPGHGPLTTVASEKIHNPFFAANKVEYQG